MAAPNGGKRELLHLAKRFRDEQKYFDVGRNELARAIDSEKYYEVRCWHETEDEDGSPVAAELRLNFSLRRPQRWSVALKLHGVRIDGIDWEKSFDLPDQPRGGEGWHRHEYDPKVRNADKLKSPVPHFDTGLVSTNEFLVRICSEMRILLNAKDVGIQDEMQFA